MPMYSSGGKTPKIMDTHVVALYHPTTGKIAHVHSITVFEGARAVSEQQAVETAKSIARKCSVPVEGLEAKLSKDPNHARKPHRIDLKSGQFVPLDPRRRVRAAKAKF